MEFAVHDVPNRRFGPLIGIALISGILAAFATFLLLPHGPDKVSNHSYLILILPFSMILAVLLLISIMTSVRIHVERATGQVFRLFTLFGRQVWRERFNLSEFDRVSLSRAFRAGYRVSLLGRQQDLIVFFTNNLGNARDKAEAVAAECGLSVSDHL
jgi:hypothetical protein